MAINFIKNIIENNLSEKEHKAFVRYSIGYYEKEDFIIKVSKNIMIYASFEYLNTMNRFFSNIIKGNITLSGVVESAKDIDEMLDMAGIEYEKKKRFGKPGSKYILKSKEVRSELYKNFIDILNDNAFVLLCAKGDGYAIKIKGSTPKIGKKTDKFITIKLPTTELKNVKEEFLFDTDKDFKEAVIKHIYDIESIVIDEKLLQKDPAKARVDAKRKGSLTRKIILDGEEVKDYKVHFEV